MVTGGAGFIGSALVNKLCELDFDVTVVDNFFNDSDQPRNEAAQYFILDAGDLYKSKLFKDNPNVSVVQDKKGRSYFTGEGAMNPNVQSSAKGYKVARRRDRIARAAVGALAGTAVGAQLSTIKR